MAGAPTARLTGQTHMNTTQIDPQSSLKNVN